MKHVQNHRTFNIENISFRKINSPNYCFINLKFKFNLKQRRNRNKKNKPLKCDRYILCLDN